MFWVSLVTVGRWEQLLLSMTAGKLIVCLCQDVQVEKVVVRVRGVLRNGAGRLS